MNALKVFTAWMVILFQIQALSQQQSNYNSQEFYPFSSQARMATKTGATEFKVMSYNVLNLFDTKHDKGKLDHTFLPINSRGKAINCQRLSKDYYREQCLRLDWTKEKLLLKLHQLKKSIALQGSLPDLLAVQEVENENVVKMLGQVLGYSNYLVTNSPDRRGIDVALLFNQNKLEYIEHQEIDVSSRVNFKTRNILRAHFRPKRGHNRSKKVIAVYVNHWPSQGKGSVTRFTASQVLAEEIVKQTNKIGIKNYHVIATGDFNTTTNDSPHPFHDMLTSPTTWDLFLYDTQSISEKSRNPMRYQMPPATYWYQREGVYNHFDRLFISQNLWSPEGVTVLPHSYRIVGTPVNSKHHQYRGRSPDYYPIDQLVPFKGNFNTTDINKLGYSDHYPVVVKFKMN